MDENRPVVIHVMLPDQRINWNWLTTVQSVPVCLHSEREGGGITSRMRVCVFKAHLPASIDGTLQRIVHQPCAGSDILHRAPPAGTNISIYLYLCA